MRDMAPYLLMDWICIASVLIAITVIHPTPRPQLETLTTIAEEDRDAIQTLAVQIFVNHKPEDPKELPEAYLKCLEVGRNYQACVITGR